MTAKPLLRLLVVEDNPDDAMLLELHLQDGTLDYDIRRAGTLKEGLQRAGAEPVVALLDLDLPDSRGLDTIKAWRKAVPHVPVVVMTGRRDRNLGLIALSHGIHGYVPKDDATTQRLEAAILQAVERARVQASLQPVGKGSLQIRQRAAQPYGHINADQAASGPAIVYVTLKRDPAEVRRNLEKRNVAAARLSLVSVAPGADGAMGFDHIEVGRANLLEDLLVAIEVACARMGSGCRVIVDDLESLRRAQDDERCMEFVRTLAKRLGALGVNGEVLVGHGLDGKDVLAVFQPVLEA